ncbi:MAG: GspH/FimT family pseudopilin [Burkholderiales bacterium]|nr:GspH/FimT family pseudopilin [Burkholderiales bacterium]
MVLVIVAIIVTMAAVHFGPSDTDRAQQEAERLQLLLENASDEAIATGQTLGWSIDGNSGYRFWRQTETGWQMVDDNDLLRPRTLPDRIRVDNVRVNLAPASEGRVVFLPSGVNTPFSMDVSTENFVRRLTADPIGHIQISGGSDAAPAAQ